MAKARCKQETFKPCEIPEMEVNAVFIDGVGGDGEAAEVIYPRPCRKQLMAQGLKMGTCRLLSPNLRADCAIFTVFWNLLLSGSEKNVFAVVLYKYRCKAHSQVHIIPGT